MYLYYTAELPEKYTLSAPLPSLQNKPEKMLYSDPSHPRSHSAGIRQKNKAFAWGPHCRPVLRQVTESVATGKDLSKEKACLSLIHTSVKMKTRLTNQSPLKSWPSSASSKYTHTACYDMTCFQESIS